MKHAALFIVLLAAGISVQTPAATETKPERKPDFVNSLGMPFVLIPAGKFVMGTPEGEWGRGRNEGPQREVTITRPFYMGQVEIVNKWFKQFVKETGYDPQKINESDFQFMLYVKSDIKEKGGQKRWEWHDDFPVLFVSWYSALRFCNWLSEKEGYPPVYVWEKDKTEGEFELPVVRMAEPYGGGYRLPTEAEWEYAARAGTKTAFFFGPDDTNIDKYSYLSGYNAPVPFRKLPPDRLPNPWGLYHMTGNAGEWCWDRYSGSYEYYETVDPTGPFRGIYRVSRDGAQGGGARIPCYSRSGARAMDFPTMTRYNLGFRVVFNEE